MARLTKKQEKSVLDGLTLMDDALFTMCFDGSAECASVMLSVLLCRREPLGEAGRIREGRKRQHLQRGDPEGKERGQQETRQVLQRDDRFRCPEEGHGIQ